MFMNIFIYIYKKNNSSIFSYNPRHVIFVTNYCYMSIKIE